MQNCLGLVFYKNVIDVYVASDIMPKSQPLIISFRDSPDQFVDTLTHELTHVLLTDNRALSLQGDMRDFELGALWQRLFDGEKDLTALVHIPVHAVLKKIMIDILHDPSRIERDKKTLMHFGANLYLKAWDYVERVGHEEIIEKS